MEQPPTSHNTNNTYFKSTSHHQTLNFPKFWHYNKYLKKEHTYASAHTISRIQVNHRHTTYIHTIPPKHKHKQPHAKPYIPYNAPNWQSPVLYFFFGNAGISSPFSSQNLSSFSCVFGSNRAAFCEPRLLAAWLTRVTSTLRCRCSSILFSFL